MSVAKKTLFIPLSLLMVFGLTACSGEPSQSDIETAIQKNIDESNEQIKSLAGGSDMKITLQSVKKINCVEAKDTGGYSCDVEIKATMPFIGEQQKTGNLRFIEKDGAWIVVGL